LEKPDISILELQVLTTELRIRDFMLNK
jgi:hypothetical protein